MEKLIEKIDKLKKELDTSKEVKDVKLLRKKIQENKELITKIDLYNQTRKEQLKKEIYSNSDYIKYKEAETNLNILILELNSKLKKINNKGKCNL